MTWMKISVDPNLMKPADLGLPCFQKRDYRVGSHMGFVWIHCMEKCLISFSTMMFSMKVIRDFSMFFHLYPES